MQRREVRGGAGWLGPAFGAEARCGAKQGGTKSDAIRGIACRSDSTAERDTEAERSAATPAAVRDTVRRTDSAAKLFGYGAGKGAVGPAGRSPGLERHLAALSCFGVLAGSRSRYIPAAVMREVWRRDDGRCSYVDRRSGRRCGSRYRLEIDHVVPFALGGAADLLNLRLHCRAHHRYRHAQRHATYECAD